MILRLKITQPSEKMVEYQEVSKFNMLLKIFANLPCKLCFVIEPENPRTRKLKTRTRNLILASNPNPIKPETKCVTETRSNPNPKAYAKPQPEPEEF